ncbi:hypothetical protein, partial [Pelomonas sp. KK5]|uniref:hypothetical protein n=1 Tax=Pelomonas sp. KK5 TaxID=1855730 RepID=UPI001301EBCB
LRLELGDAALAPTAPAEARPSAAEQPMLASSLPQQAGIGEEFGVSLSFRQTPAQAIDTQVSISYDPALLVPVSASGGEAGRVSATVSSSGLPGDASRPATIRFRVIGKQPGSTTLSYDVTGSNLPVQAPAASTLVIVGRK